MNKLNHPLKMVSVPLVLFVFPVSSPPFHVSSFVFHVQFHCPSNISTHYAAICPHKFHQWLKNMKKWWRKRLPTKIGQLHIPIWINQTILNKMWIHECGYVKLDLQTKWSMHFEDGSVQEKDTLDNILGKGYLEIAKTMKKPFIIIEKSPRNFQIRIIDHIFEWTPLA